MKTIISKLVFLHVIIRASLNVATDEGAAVINQLSALLIRELNLPVYS